MLLILMACANLKKTDLLIKDSVGCCREAIDSCSDDNIAKPHVYVQAMLKQCSMFVLFMCSWFTVKH